MQSPFRLHSRSPGYSSPYLHSRVATGLGRSGSSAPTSAPPNVFVDALGGINYDSIHVLSLQQLLDAENPDVLQLFERYRELEEEKLAAEKEVLRSEGRIETLQMLLEQSQRGSLQVGDTSRPTAPPPTELLSAPVLEELHREDYPDVLNWDGLTKDENAAELASTSTGTEAPVLTDETPAPSKCGRGRHKHKRKAPDGTENVGMKWLVAPDGNEVDRAIKKRIIKVFKRACDKLHARNLHPRSWARHVDDMAAKFVYYELENAFLVLRLCADRWKVKKVCTTYYPTWKPNGQPSKKHKIAPETHSDDDSDESGEMLTSHFPSSTVVTPVRQDDLTTQSRSHSRAHTPSEGDGAINFSASSLAPISRAPSRQDDNVMDVDIPPQEPAEREDTPPHPSQDARPLRDIEPSPDSQPSPAPFQEEEEPSLLGAVPLNLHHNPGTTTTSPAPNAPNANPSRDIPVVNSDIFVPSRGNHAKTLCGRVWKADHPSGTRKEYEKYWNTLPSDEKQHWKDEQDSLRKK